jgi:hypothetical protein
LVRLGNRKIPEPNTYVVESVNGNAVVARNKTSGRVVTRHLSRFSRLTEQPHLDVVETGDQPVKEQEPPDPHPSAFFDGALPLEVPNPVPLDREQEDRRRAQDQEDQEEQRRRQVQFNPLAREYSPPTSRQKSRQTGVPSPNFSNVQSSTLERSVRERATAAQILDQYRGDVAAARRNNLGQD